MRYMLSLLLTLILLTGCSADDISNIIGDAIGEMVDTTVDGLIEKWLTAYTTDIPTLA